MNCLSIRYATAKTRLVPALLATMLLLPATVATADGGEPISVTGELHVLIVDLVDGSASHWFEVLVEPADPAEDPISYWLISVEPLDLGLSGATVRATGTLVDDDLTLTAPLEVLEPPAPASSLEEPDINNMLIMLANFTDYTLEQDCLDRPDKACCKTNAEIAQTVFGPGYSVAEYYLENSFDTVDLQGDVAGPFLISLAQSRGCDVRKISRLTDRAATQAGWDLSAYTNRYYVVPHVPGCDWAGAAYGCGDDRAWAQGTCNDHVFAHEWGHAWPLELNHATTPGNEYGDYSDTMGPGLGARMLRHNNGPHKLQGEYFPDTPGNIVDVTASGAYVIRRLETPGSGPLALRIRDTGTQTHPHDYYISYRVPVGYDSVLAYPFRGGQFDHTSSIHEFYTSAWASGNCHISTVLRGTVCDGTGCADWVDAENGITVRQLSHDEQTATIEIVFSTPPDPCDHDGQCESGEDCNDCTSDCAGKSSGKPSGRYCCGDGIQQPAEGDGSICDGNY